MKNQSGQPGNGLGHMHTQWSGGVARFTATATKAERKRRQDRKQKQKGWD